MQPDIVGARWKGIPFKGDAVLAGETCHKALRELFVGGGIAWKVRPGLKLLEEKLIPFRIPVA